MTTRSYLLDVAKKAGWRVRGEIYDGNSRDTLYRFTPRDEEKIKITYSSSDGRLLHVQVDLPDNRTYALTGNLKAEQTEQLLISAPGSLTELLSPFMPELGASQVRTDWVLSTASTRALEDELRRRNRRAGKLTRGMVAEARHVMRYASQDLTGLTTRVLNEDYTGIELVADLDPIIASLDALRDYVRK
jgi:hypothetical protein